MKLRPRPIGLLLPFVLAACGGTLAKSGAEDAGPGM
jgi:hypothetical protein